MFQIILQNVMPSFLICTLSFSLYLRNLESMIVGQHKPFEAGALMPETVILHKIYGVDISESKGLGSCVKLDSNCI